MALSHVLPLIATGALSVLAGRVLGADLLGQQSLIAFCGALISALVVGSLTDASIQALAAQAGADGRPGSALERWVLAAHVVAGGAGAVLLVTYGLLAGDLPLAWVALAVSCWLDAAGWGYGARTIAVVGWAPVARRRLVAQLASVALAVTAVLAGHGVTGIFVSGAVSSFVLMLVLRRSAPATAPSTSFRWPRPVVRLWGLFALGEVLTQIVGRRIEFLFLAAYSTSSEIAAFSIAVMVVAAASAVPGALAGAAMPTIALAHGAGEPERARAALVRALHVTSVAALPLMALLAAVGPHVVTGLYGTEFSRAAHLVPLLALALVLTPSGQLCTTYWSALGSVRYSLTAGVLGGLLDLGLAFALVPDHGAGGAVVASVLGQSADALCVLVLTWRAFGRFPFELRGWGVSLLSCVVSGVVARAIADAVGGGLPGALVGGFAFAVVFALLAHLGTRLRAPVLAQDDVRWLTGMLPTPLAKVVAVVLLPRPGRGSETPADTRPTGR